MDLTKEQRTIIEETTTNKPGSYSIQAVAGSGKSFTIFKAIDHIKEKEPYAKILYIVFNAANQSEAAIKLRQYDNWSEPVNVRTAHSYALSKVVKNVKWVKPIEKLSYPVILEVLDSYSNKQIRYLKHKPFHWLHDKYVASKLILKTFCEEMLQHFYEDYEGPDKAKVHTIKTKRGYDTEVYGIPLNAYTCITERHIRLFKEIIELHEKKSLYTHGMYLKLAAYSDKTGGEHFDYVFFDEAQDANIFMLKLLDKQDIRKFYFVGDTKQSIYKFGGSSENVFQTRQFNKVYSLSQSFRFDDSIANLANKVLRLGSYYPLTVKGTKQTHKSRKNSSAYLYRTNSKLFIDALDFAYDAKQQGIRLKIDDMRGSHDMSNYSELLAFLKIYYKYECLSEYYENETFFRSIEDTPSSKTFLERLENDSSVNFYDVYNEQYDMLSDDVIGILNHAMGSKDNFIAKYRALIQCKIEDNPEEVFTMTTMHRSKGMEWDFVKIAESTKLYYKDKEGVVRRNNANAEQELNLIYVACTRARKELDATMFLDELLDENCPINFEDLVVTEKNKAIA